MFIRITSDDGSVSYDSPKITKVEVLNEVEDNNVSFPYTPNLVCNRLDTVTITPIKQRS